MLLVNFHCRFRAQSVAERTRGSTPPSCGLLPLEFELIAKTAVQSGKNLDRNNVVQGQRL
jgi:hypothetical protein